MQSLLQKQIWYMTKCGFYGLFLQCLLCSMLVAKEGNAQRVKLEEVKLSVKFNHVQLTEAFSQIEQKVGFNFVYEKDIVKSNQLVSFTMRQKSLMELLQYFSKEANVQFKRINENIYVTKRKDSKNNVIDVIHHEIEDVDISGKITDENGQGLPGVSIVVKETTIGIGTTTNIEGDYKLSVADGATIVISFVGYVTKEILVGNKSVIDVQMEFDATQLDEIVFIGYGSVKKENFTGAVSSIKSDNLEDRVITSLSEAFAGQLAGVVAQQASGKPGAGLIIKIRGLSTINASNAPLYVVDGIPTNNISDFNPNDILSVEVLKDASSSAIYGARGANGVVLINTKSGKVGETSFTFGMNYGVQKVDKIIDMMNRDEFIAFQTWGRNESYLRTGGSMNDPSSFRTGFDIVPEAFLSNPEALPDIDWQEQIFRTAPIQSYQLTASGGGDMGTFYISGSYMDQVGIMKETGYQRANLRLNTKLNVGKNIKVGMNIAPSFATSNNPDVESFGSVVHLAATLAPIVGLNSNTQQWGYTPGAFPWQNPVERLKETYQQTNSNKVISNVWGELAVNKSLSLRSQFGYNYSGSQDDYFAPSNVTRGAQTRGKASVNTFSEWSLQNTITYTPEISSLLDVNLLFGQSIEGENASSFSAEATGFPNDLVYTLNVASTPQNVSSFKSENSLASFFSRLNVVMKDKYLLTINFRRDGSSKFGENTKWGWFPSASLGWKIDREEFMKNADWLDLFKLRASMGKAGNNRIGNYESIALLGQSNYNLNGRIVNGLAPSSISNPDLGWETKVSKSVGIDLSVFNNRIQANFDYYVNDTKNLLLNVPVPYISGFSSQRRNIGKVQNRGWEFELTSYNYDRGHFKWHSSINIFRNTNEVKQLGIDNSPIIEDMFQFNAYITKIGEPIGSFYMYKTDGLLLDDDFDASGNPIVPIASGQEKGNIKIVDINKDGNINEGDITLVGNNQPDFTWGITNSFTYKNFNLNFLIQGSQGGDTFFAETLYLDFGQTIGFNTFPRWARSYKPAFTEAENPFPENTEVDLTWDGKTPNRFGNNPRYNDTWLYDGSFVRLKHIALSYNLPSNICERIGINGCNFTLMAANLKTWTTYPGSTPESNSLGNDTTKPSTDFGTYPLSKKYSFGINLTF